jgi:hypothetical protein
MNFDKFEEEKENNRIAANLVLYNKTRQIGTTAFGKMTLSIMTFFIMTPGMNKFSIMTPSMKELIIRAFIIMMVS